MKRPYLLPALALLGLALTIAAIIYDNQPASINTRSIPAFQPPFADYIAGTGIVEATTGNIVIGTPVSGIVMVIYVKVGDRVAAGAPLFKIDDRDLQARLLTAEATVKAAAAALQKPKHRLAYAERLKQGDPNAISAQDLGDLRDESAQAEAALALAKAQRAQLQMEIAHHTVRAPLAGEILQLKMRLGEFVEGSSTSPPLLVLGGDGDRLHLRVDVDEHDAWRVQAGAKAVAFVRSQPQLKIPLRYEYTEPYVVPKTALTGRATERTDVRVLQVIYSFKKTDPPIYTGQQLDVYIHAAADNNTKAKP